MHTYTLNVGLKPSVKTTRTAPITRREVLAAIRGAGFFVQSYEEVQSATEPTAVVKIGSGWPHSTIEHGRFYNVAAALSQDCIAVVDDENGHGWLLGPNADDWGEFNADYFVFPSATGTQQAA